MMPPRQKKAQCRFCLEDDTVTNLIAPCHCKGSFKYVHAQCLSLWYTREPIKGLECAVCKEELARNYPEELEYYPNPREVNLLCIGNPFWCIGMTHTLFFTLVNIFFAKATVNHLLVYHLFQIGFHIFYISQLYSLIRLVKNVEMYMYYWRQAPRFILPFFHFGLCAVIYKTYWLGGAAADVCLFIYLYEHLEVIQLLNQNRGFVFTSHRRHLPRLRLPLPSSSSS